MHPDHDVDYGPLAALIGTWKGREGMDVAPEPDGPEENPFYETLVVSPAGDVTNAESQTLIAVHYHQIVRRKSNDKVFHNETGYWIWEPATGAITQTFTIPRGISVIARGTVRQDGNTWIFEVSADASDIGQTPFLQQNARTLRFAHTVEVTGDRMTYSETTLLDIYGRRFEHTDGDTLTRAE
ncbi:MAG: DUF1794 domain-containing protein [Gammaproteobacteria bacterium]|nr:MAG: DUF1794 domain-containing protein [Gammaproteobacteria bacterium]